MSRPAGERLFARYAHAPNALGHCGPAEAARLDSVAAGRGDDVDVAELATRFTGAWPYQVLIAELTGQDPMSERVGRAYWTGNDLTHSIDAQRFGRLLLDRFSRQAGHYWKHLTDDLLDEVTPTHAFHVFGVYPWTRLLAAGVPEALGVLDSCRIRLGEVVEAGRDRAVLLIDTLTWDGTSLGVSPARPEPVSRRTAAGDFTGELRPGDLVAVHWGLVCDRLDAAQAGELTGWTARQLDLTNRRFRR